jgi:hypothetical protein
MRHSRIVLANVHKRTWNIQGLFDEKKSHSDVNILFLLSFFNQCECMSGYLRDPRDHTKCKATEGHASLLFARRHDIRKISLDHREMTSIVNDTKSATALDYVFRTGMIFWSDVTEQRIYK